MAYGALDDATRPLAPAVAVSGRRIFGAALIATLGVAGCVGVYAKAAPAGVGTAAAALDAVKPKPFDVDGVVAHDIDPSKAPFDTLTLGNVLPADAVPVFAQGAVYAATGDEFSADVDLSAALCGEFDDDSSFPDAACDCGDTRTQCHGNMDRLPAYRDACFEAACGAENMAAYDAFPAPDATQQCAGLIRPVWGVPCMWQAVKAMPETCAGSFVPTFPAGKSRNAPDPYPDLDGYERYSLGYSPGGNFAGSCDAHAFCSECLDDDYDGGVNPYCRAVFKKYGHPFAVGAGDPDKRYTHHTGFFADLDYWCQDSVLAALADEADAARRR